MSVSLKEKTYCLAPRLNMSPDALYERQRSLLRTGLLKSRLGRGPGSGVEATASSLAILIISILAAENLRDASERTKSIMRTEPITGLCKLSGAKTFGEAITKIIRRDCDTNRILAVVVSRCDDSAIIVYDEHRGSQFKGKAATEDGIRSTAFIMWPTLRDCIELCEVAP